MAWRMPRASACDSYPSRAHQPGREALRRRLLRAIIIVGAAPSGRRRDRLGCRPGPESESAAAPGGRPSMRAAPRLGKESTALNGPAGRRCHRAPLRRLCGARRREASLHDRAGSAGGPACRRGGDTDVRAVPGRGLRCRRRRRGRSTREDTRARRHGVIARGANGQCRLGSEARPPCGAT